MKTSRLSDQEYIDVKNHAYRSLKFYNTLSWEDKLNFIKFGTPYNDKKISYKIFVYTLLFPNDLELMYYLKKGKSTKQLCNEFKIPFNVLVTKQMEYGTQNLEAHVLLGKINARIANQPLQNDTEDIDLLLKVFFPEQNYIQNQSQMEEKHKQRVLEYMNPKTNL